MDAMQQVLLFPMAEYWGVYALFVLFVLVMLALDLGVFHKNAHEVTVKESLIWSVVWFSCALVFNVLLFFYARSQFALNERLMSIPGFSPETAANQVSIEFLTGFIIEKALAIDNIFVFVVVFSYFGIPALYQHRVLFYGIIGALFFRAIFIAIGASLMQYHVVVMIAGAFLVLTGIKILLKPETQPDPGKNPLVNFAKRILPVTDKLHGDKFIVKVGGVRHVTPLFLALLFIEFSDIIFAIDSVPAIFAITKEPLIVFTSNVFAILGLRSLYFLLADMVDKFHYLKYGLGFILIFVGLKMTVLNELFGGKFPITWSLAIIAAILGSSVAASFAFPKKVKA